MSQASFGHLGQWLDVGHLGDDVFPGKCEGNLWGFLFQSKSQSNVIIFALLCCSFVVVFVLENLMKHS